MEDMILFLYLIWCIIILFVIKFYVWLDSEREYEKVKKKLYERKIAEYRRHSELCRVSLDTTGERSEPMEVNSSQKYEGRIRVRYQGIEYWAYRKSNDFVRIVDFPTGWLNVTYLPKWTQDRRCWNVYIDNIVIIPKIYLGGE